MAEYLFLLGRFSHLLVKLKNHLQQDSTTENLQQIVLRINVRTQTNYFRVVGFRRSIMLLSRQKTRKSHLPPDPIPVTFLTHGNIAALEDYLLRKFVDTPTIDAKAVAEKIARQWVSLTQEGGVISVEVKVKLFHFVLLQDTVVSASVAVVEDMLKRIEREEIGEDGRICMLCLEEMKNEVSLLLQLPCLHAFHGECIKNWLKNSHYCPNCRFKIPPTN